MNKQAAIRVGWGVSALPLALIVIIASLATWPLLLNNSLLRLALLAYIVLLPLAPAVWRLDSRRLLLWGIATVVAQIIAFGIINFWF